MSFIQTEIDEYNEIIEKFVDEYHSDDIDNLLLFLVLVKLQLHLLSQN